MLFRTTLFLSAAALAGTTACGGKVVVDAAGATGAGGSVVAPIAPCGPGAPEPFPTFDKTCANDADCVIKVHRNFACCAPHAAIGLNAAAGADFDAAETTCESKQTKSVCDCFGPTKAEDGNQASGGAMIEVACQSGQCMTFVP
jgi:hypothetical protein